ncbi:MAG: Gfo/Idh/MocA family oxidoreductase, partial [Candidatus Brocadiia bacterium]
MCAKTKPLRAVVVGCRMGRRHARAMAALEDYEVVGVCDLEEETARQAAEHTRGARIYADFGEMLETERPDVVGVATPTDSHAKLTIAAAQSGVQGVCC